MTLLSIQINYTLKTMFIVSLHVADMDRYDTGSRRDSYGWTSSYALKWFDYSVKFKEPSIWSHVIEIRQHCNCTHSICYINIVRNIESPAISWWPELIHIFIWICSLDIVFYLEHSFLSTSMLERFPETQDWLPLSFNGTEGTSKCSACL